MQASRMLLGSVVCLGALLGTGGCDRDTREADPYAARYATTKPAYVRTAASATTPAPTVTDSGVAPEFTSAQSTAGAVVYASTCSRCHALSQWSGGTFAAGWQNRRVSDFHDLVSATMPQDNPGSLSAEQYLNVTAYILEQACFATGPVAMRADTATLRHARINIKPKPAS